MSRLRPFLERPIVERDRMRLFTLVAALLLLAAAALTATSAREADRPAPATAPTPATVPAAATGASTSAGAPVAVLDAGRRFLADYLPYLYGRGDSPRFETADAGLRRLLRRRPPRVAAVLRGRHPRLVALTGHRLSVASRWVLTALIADGHGTRYPLDVVLAAGRAGEPLVIALGED